MTATAIVLDSTRMPKSLLPDYAVRGGENDVTEFATYPVGPVVARASKKDIIRNATAEGAGVVLARLEENALANNDNALSVFGRLKAVAPVPPDGAEIEIFSHARGSKSSELIRSGVIQKVEGPFVITKARITEPGDAGAPVLNADGELIAMGYIGTAEESRLLSVDWVFQKAGLKLVQ